MKSVAFINQKGGVGKTTSTLNVGVGLARAGKKVLLIDLDPQASLTYSLGIQADELSHTIFELLQAVSEDPAKCTKQVVSSYIMPLDIPKAPGIELLPSSMALTGLEELLEGHKQKKYLLRHVMTHLHNYDYVFVDCPPNLGLVTVNVLVAVDEIYVPVETEFLALQGLQYIMSTVNAINKTLNPALKLGGIIGTKYGRRKLHEETVGYLKTIFPQKVFNTVIRQNIALAEAPSFGKDIYSYSARSTGAKDYSALCKEILKLEKTGKGASL